MTTSGIVWYGNCCNRRCNYQVLLQPKMSAGLDLRTAVPSADDPVLTNFGVGIVSVLLPDVSTSGSISLPTSLSLVSFIPQTVFTAVM
jgi:hypothetical protein